MKEGCEVNLLAGAMQDRKGEMIRTLNSQTHQQSNQQTESVYRDAIPINHFMDMCSIGQVENGSLGHWSMHEASKALLLRPRRT
jgi:hypothetical protein